MDKKIKTTLIKWSYRFLLIMGGVNLAFILLAFTDIPYYAYHSLSVNNKVLEEEADVIVLMGGDGMPSPNSLLRIYHTAELLKDNPHAQVIIAQPTNEYDSTYQLDLMRSNLIAIGVDSLKIKYATTGYNTRTQALEIANKIPLESKLIIVSSAEHMYRSLKSFNKVGFKQVGSGATFENPVEEEGLKDKNKQTKKIQNLTLRYNLWSYMQYEIRVIREYTAIVYYWLNGWI